MWVARSCDDDHQAGEHYPGSARQGEMSLHPRHNTLRFRYVRSRVIDTHDGTYRSSRGERPRRRQRVCCVSPDIPRFLEPLKPLHRALGRLQNAPTDNDRLRLIKTMARNFSFKAEQAARVVAACHAPAVAVDAAQVVCSRLVDPDHLTTVVDVWVSVARETSMRGARRLPYEESKAELRRRLGV